MINSPLHEMNGPKLKQKGALRGANCNAEHGITANPQNALSLTNYSKITNQTA